MPKNKLTMAEQDEGKYTYKHAPCMYCKHLIAAGTQDYRDGWSCKAFPEGINYAILTRAMKHDEVNWVQEGSYVFESKAYSSPNGPEKITFKGTWYPANEEPPKEE